MQMSANIKMDIKMINNHLLKYWPERSVKTCLMQMGLLYSKSSTWYLKNMEGAVFLGYSIEYT